VSRALVDTITVQRATVAISAAGSPTETWATLVTLRAERLQQSTEERLQAAGATGETIAVFRVHHVDGITTADRILFAGAAFAIREIVPTGRRRWLELRAVALEGGV
jgi:SPP1 family predicted phage head-tail adaptor